MELAFLLANPRYAVSRCGRVFSFNQNGRCRERRAQIHRAHQTATPYRMLSLILDGREQTVKVAALVMSAFGSPRPSEMHCIAHEDGDSLRDHIDNLRWKTYAANNDDRHRHGTMPRGESSGGCKLTEDAVRELRRMGKPLQRHADKYGISLALASAVIRGKVWRHVV